jgi:predicted phage-related endonuclease
MIEKHKITSRQEWLAMRSHFLTASDLAAAAGVDQYKPPLSLYAEKTGLTVTHENAPMVRGRYLEHAAFAALKERLPGWRLLQPATFLCDPKTRLGCTPDVLAEDEDGDLVLIQIKAPGPASFERWQGTPPVGYQLQTLCEAMLTGAARGILAAFVVDSYSAELHLFDIARHPEAEKKIVEIAREFWDNIAAGRRPAPDYTRDAETIAAMFPPDPDVPAPLDLSADNRIYSLLEERARLKAEEKAAVDQCKALDSELVDKLQGATVAIAGEWKITRKMQHRDERLQPASDFPVMHVTRPKARKELAA